MLRAIVLGAVQGLTEFLPISSSAHLVLVPFVLGWGVDRPVPGVPTLPFVVALHMGTLIALVAYFWRDLWAIAAGAVRTVARRADERDRGAMRLLGLLLLGSIPAAVVGIVLHDALAESFEEPAAVSLQLIGTAVLLLYADAIHERRSSHRDEASIGPVDALLMGAFQALAILPGISRSGATIAAGVGRGLSREAAARFSLLLAIPAILGAGLVEVPGLRRVPDLAPVIAGTIVAAVVGFASIWFLLRYLRSGRLRPFAVYCVVAAAIGLVYWLQVK